MGEDDHWGWWVRGMLPIGAAPLRCGGGTHFGCGDAHETTVKITISLDEEI